MIKTLIATLILTLSQSALASDLLMGMVIGNMMSDGGERVITKEVKVDKFSMIVEETHKQMDKNINQKIPVVTIDYKGFNVDEFETYFKMKNFTVLKDDTKLTFNLSNFVLAKINNEQMQKWRVADKERRMNSAVFWFGIGFIFFIFLMVVLKGNEAALIIMLVYNFAWIFSSGSIIFPSKPQPEYITQLPTEIKQKLPGVWQEANLRPAKQTQESM